MPQEFTETTEKMLYGGPLPWAVLVGIGVAAVIVVGFLAWREARTVRWWLAPVVAVLRLAAIGVVLWMLAGLSVVTVTKHSRPKSVAILVDTSGSMGLADTTDSAGNAVRWALLNETNRPSEILRSIDGAAATLGMASGEFNRFADDCRQAGGGAGAARHITAVRGGVDEAAQLASRFCDRGPPALAGDVGKIRDQLKESVATELQALDLDQNEGRLQVDEKANQRLAEMRETLSGLARRMSRLSDTAAIGVQESADPTVRDRLREVGTWPRLERAGSLLEEAEKGWLGEMRKKARVISYQFAEKAAPVGSENWRVEQTAWQKQSVHESSTNLAGALEQVAQDAAGQDVEALLLLTDGIDNAGGDPLRVASGLSDLPIVVVPVGNPDPVRDVVLHHVQAPNAVFLNDKAIIEGTVDATGCSGEEILVELLEGGAVVDHDRFRAGGDSFVRRVTFARQADHIGQHQYTMRVRPVANTRTGDQNEVQINLEVVEDKIHVLLADNLPRWEYRYLHNLFKRDDRIQYQAMQFEPHRESGAPAEGRDLPKDAAGWNQFQVVILGDLPPSVLDTGKQALLNDFVAAHGGTAIIIAGDEAMPQAYAGTRLAQMLPVLPWGSAPENQAGFGLTITAEGQTADMLQVAENMPASDQAWREITARLPLYGLSTWSRAKPAGHVLISAVPRSLAQQQTGEERPAFLSWQYYGQGKVVFVAAPVTYELRLRRGDEMHHRFWGQLLRWAIARDVAVGSKTVHVATDKPDYMQGEKVQVTVRLNRPGGFGESGGACGLAARLAGRTVASINLTEDPDLPGTYKGTLDGLPAGQITLQPTGNSVAGLLKAEGYSQPVEAKVRIDLANSAEFRNTRTNLPLLTELARCSNGVVAAPAGVAAAMAHVNLSPQVSERSSQKPLWDQWWCLWIFFGCLVAEWITRKLGGLA